ncbi:MAG: polysaccharide deacetylase family protein [Streptococcaceae bacterium]|jgi:peptidoglycan/xylan/chitin deacetylase (PgdA/CDA1 family)|nr:polysaccharide deacetylase family protein [Streptococcaceae bacterium]
MEKRSRRRKKSPLPYVLFTALVLVVLALVFVVVFKPFADSKKPVSTGNSISKAAAGQSKSQASSPAASSSAVVPENWLLSLNENKLPTMMYHNVSPDTPNSNYVTPENLESALQQLQQNDIYTVSTNEAYQILNTKTKPAEKIIWLTFDDGYQDFYDHVFPLLKKYKMHATSNLITSYIESGKPGYMTPSEIQEMADSGYVDFQSHTVDHIDLNTASDEDQISQLSESKTYIDKLINQKVTMLCYPAGSHNANTAGIAEKLGYKMGILDPGRTYDGKTAVNAAATASDGMFALNRYRTFTETDGTALMAMIAEDEAYNAANTQK